MMPLEEAHKAISEWDIWQADPWAIGAVMPITDTHVLYGLLKGLAIWTEGRLTLMEGTVRAAVRVCGWAYDEFGGYCATDCGRTIDVDGPPDAIGWEFCPACGGRIET